MLTAGSIVGGIFAGGVNVQDRDGRSLAPFIRSVQPSSIVANRIFPQDGMTREFSRVGVSGAFVLDMPQAHATVAVQGSASIGILYLGVTHDADVDMVYHCAASTGTAYA